ADSIKRLTLYYSLVIMISSILIGITLFLYQKRDSINLTSYKNIFEASLIFDEITKDLQDNNLINFYDYNQIKKSIFYLQELHKKSKKIYQFFPHDGYQTLEIELEKIFAIEKNIP